VFCQETVALKQFANEYERDDGEWKMMCKGATVAYIKGALPSFG
jgi:hypothetical protein